jgi:hypothetical protein
MASTCTAGTPVSCDDRDPLTVDGCDPAVGCTHTTTTLPGGACGSDADCPPDADPCTVEACDPAAGCISRPVGGFDGLACICRRTNPASCDGITLPRNVTTKRSRACALIGRAATKPPTKARKLVGRAGKLLAGAERRLAKAKQLSPACRQDMVDLLADGAARAGAQRTQL